MRLGEGKLFKRMISEFAVVLFLVGILAVALSISHAEGIHFSIVHHSNVVNFADLPRSRSASGATPPSPGFYETSEYFIGSVAVGVIFLESNGAIDPNTEDWTSDEVTQVMNGIQHALDWWSQQNPSASVSFTVADTRYGVPTSYEPISRSSQDDKLWINQAMAYIGYPGTVDNYKLQVYDYLNNLRTTAHTSWAYAIFAVDSSNDADGKFTDGLSAYTIACGGPYVVVPSNSDGWGIANYDRVVAHETGHVFYATDEYNNKEEWSGYLNAHDNDGSGDLMDKNEWQLSDGTKLQIGWRDSNNNGILDIADTFPKTVLNAYAPDPTDQSTLTYTGTVREVPLQNNNPLEAVAQRHDITINKITKVEFRVDEGAWQDAAADDGAFDQSEEHFSFTVSLFNGTHTIEARGTNSVGNVEPPAYVHDEVTCVLTFTFDPTPLIIILAFIAFAAVATVAVILRARKRPVTSLPPPPPPPPLPPPPAYAF